MGSFNYADGDWRQFRQYDPAPREVDFHWSECGRREIPYWAAMERVRRTALDELKLAHARGEQWLLFTHGSSTSLGWKRPTARSQVRGLMRSSESTPYIIRSKCVQHESVFLAAIRPPSVSD